MKTGLNDVNTFPDGIKTKEAFLLFEEKFSVGTVTPAGFISPAEIVIDGDLNDPAVAEAASALRLSLFENPAFPVPPEFIANEANDLALITLSFPGRPNSPAAADLVRVIREQIIPASFEGVPADVYVGGASATLADFQGIVSLYTPIVFALVLGLSFIILMMVFRSIVIPLKAIIMNLLAVGATYGLLVLVFQKGFGTDLFGFQRAEVIDAWMPLFLFAVLFGLSMDYHVFLLSRIRERYDETGDNTEAVAYGLRSTAGIITGAALIMVAVFGGFATGRSVINQLMGFGLAVAVFLDASFVRSILVPASMEVLGARNWYLPPFLRWLPDLKVEAEEGH
ncbi:MAG: MMPL family transporter [Acidimicrobiia bacterium]|nr:MMPL family transporter [Acidimicrobiia bacterium]